MNADNNPVIFAETRSNEEKKEAKMLVTKRDGRQEPVNLDKILKSIGRVCEDIEHVDAYSIATKTINGLYDGVTTKELDELSIRTAVGLIPEDPDYSKVASRLLSNYIDKEVRNQDIESFSQSIRAAYDQGLINEQTYELVKSNSRKLNNVIKTERNDHFGFLGLQIVYDRYLLKHPTSRKVLETPQYWLLRVACGLSDNPKEAIEFYNLLSSHDYMTSTPTLFNSGTAHSQMSSCYLLDSPMDDLRDIYKRKSDVALLSKFAGGIGVSMSRVRGSGSLIKGTNGRSNGIIPFVHTLDASVAAVNQGGRRKGAACVYLETWHPDIMEFLELRDNTGDKEKRAHNLNIANWIPDLFMKRLEEDGEWSLIDPTVAPDLPDLYGEEFEKRYLELEAQGKVVKTIPARKVYARMMRTLAETGNGWINFKDTANRKGNQVFDGNVIHLSNLCTEILEVTNSGKYQGYDQPKQATNIERPIISHYDPEEQKYVHIDGAETAVCNLGSINISKFVKNDKLDKVKLRKVVATAVKFLDKVIDRNYYPTPEAFNSNMRWRPIGLGLMGLQDFFYKLKLPFESEEAVNLSREIQEEIYYQSVKTSCELAKEYGPHPEWEKTHAGQGRLQFDLWGLEVKDKRWEELKADIAENGIRNSLMIAIAPTATISDITGVYECIEPVKSHILRKVTLSGDFVIVNRYLVDELKALGLWNKTMLNKIKEADGSIQNIDEIPDELKNIYKTVWEMKQKYLIDHAAARGPFIDQSQSLNLFMDVNRVPEEQRIRTLSSMYMYAWKNGIKTTYYFRSKAATRIQKITSAPQEEKTKDLENPEVCESCT